MRRQANLSLIGSFLDKPTIVDFGQSSLTSGSDRSSWFQPLTWVPGFRVWILPPMSDSDLLDSASDPYPQGLTLAPVTYSLILLVGLEMGFDIYEPYTYNFCRATCCFLE